MTEAKSADAPHFLIVGGGVAGCSLAYALARRGARALLVEAGEFGTEGASAVPVALLNPYRGRSARAGDLDRLGLAAMGRLARELAGLGFEPGVQLGGVLRIASNARQARTWRRREGVRWLEPGEVPAGYHAPHGGFLVEQGGWVEPRKLLAALVAAAKSHGAEVREGCRVEGLEFDNDGVTVRGSLGPQRARAVILCTGAAPAAHLGAPDLERVAGDVIGLEADLPLPYPLAGAVYAASLGEHVYLGGNHRPAGQDDPSAPEQLQRAAGWFVPGLRTARCDSVWTGVRAKAADNAPLAAELRPGLWFLGALAGRGFLCAAYLAETLASQLLERNSAWR